MVISWCQECVCKVHPFGLITIAPLSLMRIITGGTIRRCPHPYDISYTYMQVMNTRRLKVDMMRNEGINRQVTGEKGSNVEDSLHIFPGVSTKRWLSSLSVSITVKPHMQSAVGGQRRDVIHFYMHLHMHSARSTLHPCSPLS